MIAKSLEAILADASHRSAADMVARFQRLRDIRLLPNSRGKNAEELSSKEIVYGVLSVVAAKPEMSAMTAKYLYDLRPVGGSSASFQGAATFGEALEATLAESAALKSLLEVRVTDSEIYTNANGRGGITFRSGNGEKTAHYVRKEAVSLLIEGADRSYNPREGLCETIVELVLSPRIFARIDRRVRDDARHFKMMNHAVA